MNLPKLRACPICGEEPEWYNGWYDITRAMGGLTVLCKCDKMYITPYPYSLDELIRNDNLGKTIVDDVSRRWEKFCKKVVAKCDEGEVK